MWWCVLFVAWSSLSAALSLDRGFVKRAVDAARPSVCVVTPSGVRNTTFRGSGVVVRCGERVGVLTAAHVAMPGWRLEVMFDGVAAAATVVGREPESDLAFLEVEGLGAREPLQFRDADLGEFAIALGYPGVAKEALAATLGVVSTATPDLLLADAAVAPGMSGGPLVDADGAVLGITTRLAMPLGGSSVPAAACLRFLEGLPREAASTTSGAATTYKVVLFNDPFNTRSRVEQVLGDAGLRPADASRAMREAHQTGQGLVREFANEARDAADDLCLRLRAADLLVEVIALTTDEEETTTARVR
ncbi:hypothetical protein CTAYLR_008130 [Chrysophaeum taylorii]|uniref:Adaptor protein ClpS core domain-containing protein n=1 Tax=Chrysophaeum taylorii TaxID=2483200 RepID=A0AAD7UJZ3_9STRA|nr:hypothetical protein CTAYLR_008130 [Chrysophaeum taylorii]